MDIDSCFYVFKSWSDYCRFHAYDVGAYGVLVGDTVATTVRFGVSWPNGDRS